MPITLSPDTLIRDVVETYKGSEAVFAAHGLPCAGCHVSTRESIRGGASVHRLDLDVLMADLERFIADGTVPPSRRKAAGPAAPPMERQDRKSTRLNSSHVEISYAVFCLKK